MKKFKKDSFLVLFNEGDENAFMEVYDFYVSAIYRFIYYKARQDKSVSEDLTQKVFIKVWEYVRANKKPIENIQAFLYMVARNLVIDYWRGIGKEQVISSIEDSDGAIDEEFNHIDAVDAKLTTEKVIDKLNDIPERYKEVIVMRFIDELEIDEIAKILNKDKNGVYVLIHRALKSLRKRFANNQ